MALESTVSKNLYQGDGAATAFPFSFKVWDAAQLSVLLTSPDGTSATAQGWTATLSETGGTVNYLHQGQPLPSGWKLAIIRNMPFTQEVNLISGSRFDPEVIETALDVATAERQQLLERLGRAVVLDAASEQTPQELLAEIRNARDTSTLSATNAAASANAANDSARAGAQSASQAAEQREAACLCAQEAKDARDVALLQTETVNTLMETELGKVNALLAANRTDQQAAITAARAWSEKAADAPVEYDAEGQPLYSARHWAEHAQKIAIEPPTPESRGAIRVGSGLHLENQDMLAADVATSDKAGIIQPDNITTQVNADGVLSALGGNLLYNEEVWITESGTWTAPVSCWYDLWIIGGGGGAWYARDGDIRKVNSGSSGGYLFTLKHFNAGDTVAVTIGAAGVAYNAHKNGNPNPWNINYGGITTFGDLASNSAGAFAFVYNPGVGVPNQNGTAYVNVHGVGFGNGAYNGPASFYGGSGGALVYQYNPSHTEVVQLQNGKQGAVRLRFWNPAKANG